MVDRTDGKCYSPIDFEISRRRIHDQRRQVHNLETRGAVAKITINRPEKRNALSRDAIREILAVFEELRNDDSIAVVLTTGAGDVAYCAGRDLSEFPTEGGQEPRQGPAH